MKHSEQYWFFNADLGSTYCCVVLIAGRKSIFFCSRFCFCHENSRKAFLCFTRLPNGEPERETIPQDIQETLDKLKENFHGLEATIRQQRLYLTSLTLQQVSSVYSLHLKPEATKFRKKARNKTEPQLLCVIMTHCRWLSAGRLDIITRNWPSLAFILNVTRDHLWTHC